MTNLVVSDPPGPEPGADPKAPAAGTGDNPFLRAALMYAARGWRVHPLRPGEKAALLKSWPELATTDTDTIRGWWAKYPTANVGLGPGPKSGGLAVVDIDPRNGGLATWARLREKIERDQLAGLVVRTGSGGFHAYYNTSAIAVPLPKVLGPGVEVHAHDTLNIVAPPSIHPNGHPYTWLAGGVPLPYPDAWLRALDMPTLDEKPKLVGTGDVLKARQALQRLDPARADEYETWLTVGMALKSVSDELLSDWDAWSRGSTKYAAGRCEAKWATFDAKPGGLTLASLVAWANDDEERGGLVFADTVQVEPIDWLWHGRVAFGKLCGLVGMPDQGKDVLACTIAAHISRGTKFPDGRPAPDGPRPTYYLSVEDALSDTTKPRFLAAGGDARYLVTRNLIRRNGHDKMITLDEDRDVVQRDLADIQRRLGCGPGLVVLSPYDAFLSAKVDSWKTADIRRALAPIAALMDQTGWALLAIAHLTKSENRKLLHRIAGSQAFAAALRMAYLVAVDPTDTQQRRRHVVPVKRNLLPPDVTGLAFELTSVPTPELLRPGPKDTVPRIKWGGESRLSGAELLLDPGEQSESDRADAWLLEQFTTADRDLTSKELEERAIRDGKRWNTVRKRLPEIGAAPVEVRDANGKKTGSVWHLEAPRF
jgi:hypothetical protein